MNPYLPDALIETLQARFARHMHRHPGMAWAPLEERLAGSHPALAALGEMERTGGEPDVIGYDDAAGQYLVCDCSVESPAGRRSLCFDRQALDARKENKPRGCAAELAAAMGVALLTETQYRQLQQLDEFDTRTSSWIATPADVRARGGALFCDRRYGRVFVYHSGAESYYAARGFRALLRL